MARRGGGEPGDSERVLHGHSRRSSLKSVRVRLLLPIAVTTAGLAVLGLVQTRTAVDTARSAEHSLALSRALTTTVRLNHQLEQEVAESADLLLRGGKAGMQLLTAQQARTDAAVRAFQEAASAVASQSQGLADAVTLARAQLGELGAMRAAALRPASAQDDFARQSSYDDLAQALVAMAEAVSVQPVDHRLAANARVAAVLSAADHKAAQERSLLRDVFARGYFVPAELAELAALRGSEMDRTSQFQGIAGPAIRARYAELVSGPDVDKARTMVEAALRADAQPRALDIDPDQWYIAQTNSLHRLYLFQLEVITTLEGDAAILQAEAKNQATSTGVLTLTVVALAILTAIVFAVSLSRRLRRVRSAAQNITSTELPEAVAAVSAAPSPSTVRSVTQASQDRVTAWLAGGDNDEIGELAAALSGLHRQALRLAADQALLRLDVARTFVALSRRGQTLVQRQLQLIDEFEQAETDPETLHRLFLLDHLAARMRRNEENLLVLAGADPGRMFTQPELVADVVMAAASEIEDYARVDAAAVQEAWVDAYVVGDLVHLLAELLENAVIFSPPGSKVVVSSHRTVDALTIQIYDRGIGIPNDQLERYNDLLRHPSMLTSESASRMGLTVVARLAQRLDIHVELRSGPTAGTVALVGLPSRLLPPAHAVGQRRGTELANRSAEQAAPALPAQELPKPLVPAPALPVLTPPGFTPAPREVQPLVVPAFVIDPLSDDTARIGAAVAEAAPAAVVAEAAAAVVGAEAAASEHFDAAGFEAKRKRFSTSAAQASTPAGLPQRAPGEALVVHDVATAATERRVLDPELARARLSSLASGLAAAQRQASQPR
jgi:signal transduction histidine kinase